jgi:UDP-2-acetamido-2,6-beta-L-arabino-hexul-4-ose reductase
LPVEHRITLGELANTIQSFKESRVSRYLPKTGDSLINKLYATYLSYLPKDGFIYDLVMHVDQRGSFTEFIRTEDYGQVSVNVSNPGIGKGDHWHHTKNEKFLVVSGSGVIKFRKIDEEEIIEYQVTGDKLQVVDIPVGYTHSIINTGETEMVTIMWANECFDPENPDTMFLEVE